LNACVEEQLRIIKSAGTPLYLEVVKAIASLCGVDPYRLWEWIASRSSIRAAAPQVSRPQAQAQQRASGACWRCPACGRTFESPSKLASHILYFLRKRDYAHIKLYKEIKKKVEETGKTFTKVVEEFTC